MVAKQAGPGGRMRAASYGVATLLSMTMMSACASADGSAPQRDGSSTLEATPEATGVETDRPRADRSRTIRPEDVSAADPTRQHVDQETMDPVGEELKLISDLPRGQASAGLDVGIGPSSLPRSREHAVTAFVSQARMILTTDPTQMTTTLDVVEQVTSALDPMSAQMLIHRRAHAMHLDVTDGAYRILGASGGDSAPRGVMLELVAPMTMNSNDGWFAGGVIVWKDDRWQMQNLSPRRELLGEAEHSESFDLDIPLPGLGWRTFADGDG